MGLFDKFRKKVRDAASEINSDDISAEEGSDEATAAINQHLETTEPEMETIDDDWEEIDETEELVLPENSDDEWDDWDDEDW